MPEITLNINGVTLTVHTPTEDPLDQFEKVGAEPEAPMGCSCDQGESINHDYAAAVNMAQAAQHIRMAMEHIADPELDDIVEDLERLTAEYLASS